MRMSSLRIQYDAVEQDNATRLRPQSLEQSIDDDAEHKLLVNLMLRAKVPEGEDGAVIAAYIHWRQLKVQDVNEGARSQERSRELLRAVRDLDAKLFPTVWQTRNHAVPCPFPTFLGAMQKDELWPVYYMYEGALERFYVDFLFVNAGEEDVPSAEAALVMHAMMGGLGEFRGMLSDLIDTPAVRAAEWFHTELARRMQGLRHLVNPKVDECKPFDAGASKRALALASALNAIPDLEVPAAAQARQWGAGLGR